MMGRGSASRRNADSKTELDSGVEVELVRSGRLAPHAGGGAGVASVVGRRGAERLHVKREGVRPVAAGVDGGGEDAEEEEDGEEEGRAVAEEEERRVDFFIACAVKALAFLSGCTWRAAAGGD